MSKEKAERHLAHGDNVMQGGSLGTTTGMHSGPKFAFSLYNSALGNYQKIDDIEGQRVALSRMLQAAKAWGNPEMEANCQKWLTELDES